MVRKRKKSRDKLCFSYSKRLRELRLKHGYTQEKVADLSGVEYKHIQRIEGKTPPDARLSTLSKVAGAFDMSLSEFLEPLD